MKQLPDDLDEFIGGWKKDSIEYLTDVQTVGELHAMLGQLTMQVRAVIQFVSQDTADWFDKDKFIFNEYFNELEKRKQKKE